MEKINVARQSFPITYDPNGYVDIIRSQLVKQQRVLHGERVQAFVTDRTYEVDVPADFDYLEYLVAGNPNYFDLLFG